MKGLGIWNKPLQQNIVDLFPGSPTDPDRWSLYGEWTYTHTHHTGFGIWVVQLKMMARFKDIKIVLTAHNVYQGINPPPSKTPPLLFCQAPPPLHLNLQPVQTPLFRQSPPLYQCFEVEVQPSPPFWKFGRRFNPPSRKKGEVHIMLPNPSPHHGWWWRK